MAVLVTGGAGYIGSHTAVELLESGRKIVITDNFYNSKPVVLDIIKEITGKDFKFCLADICDAKAVDKIFGENEITEVVHFAGYKAVGESVAKPLEYYGNNVGGARVLLEAMNRHGVRKFVFSSSACVYGIPKKAPVTEETALSAINPYGQTKLIIENMCRDLYVADNSWQFSLLRYFNPVGAHKSHKLGENPNGIPNNLVPVIIQVLNGSYSSPQLSVYGNDYPTPDGTCIRDYIHVVDLAKGHIAALNALKPGAEAYNLGTGKGSSVLEVINAFEKVNGVKVPWVNAPRRAGDAAACWSDPAKAERELNWKAEAGLEQMCHDAWESARQ